RLRAWGYRLVIIPSDLQRAAIRAMEDVLAVIRRDGNSAAAADRMATFAEREAAVDTAGYLALDRRFAPCPNVADGEGPQAYHPRERVQSDRRGGGGGYSARLRARVRGRSAQLGPSAPFLRAPIPRHRLLGPGLPALRRAQGPRRLLAGAGGRGHSRCARRLRHRPRTHLRTVHGRLRHPALRPAPPAARPVAGGGGRGLRERGR